jgi:hypothetical protein
MMSSVNLSVGLMEPSAKRTKAEKLQAMIQWLTERHLMADGGYPYDHVRRGDEIIIAALHDGGQDNETEIHVHSVQRLLKAYDQALQMLKTFSGVDDSNRWDAFEQCLWDTEYHESQASEKS